MAYSLAPTRSNNFSGNKNTKPQGDKYAESGCEIKAIKNSEIEFTMLVVGEILVIRLMGLGKEEVGILFATAVKNLNALLFNRIFQSTEVL